jgi:uncharacterized membrane protein YfcA
MLAILIGLISGIVSGMGIGGGTILIPSLVFLLGTRQHTAQSINLLVFVPTAITAILVHLKNKNIEKSIIVKLITYGSIGAVIGSYLAVNLESELMKKFFGAFLLIMGVYEIISKDKNKGKNSD